MHFQWSNWFNSNSHKLIQKTVYKLQNICSIIHLAVSQATESLCFRLNSWIFIILWISNPGNTGVLIDSTLKSTKILNLNLTKTWIQVQKNYSVIGVYFCFSRGLNLICVYFFRIFNNIFINRHEKFIFNVYPSISSNNYKKKD